MEQIFLPCGVIAKVKRRWSWLERLLGKRLIYMAGRLWVPQDWSVDSEPIFRNRNMVEAYHAFMLHQVLVTASVIYTLEYLCSRNTRRAVQAVAAAQVVRKVQRWRWDEMTNMLADLLSERKELSVSRDVAHHLIMRSLFWVEALYA